MVKYTELFKRLMWKEEFWLVPLAVRLLRYGTQHVMDRSRIDSSDLLFQFIVKNQSFNLHFWRTASLKRKKNAYFSRARLPRMARRDASI